MRDCLHTLRRLRPQQHLPVLRDRARPQRPSRRLRELPPGHGRRGHEVRNPLQARLHHAAVGPKASIGLFYIFDMINGLDDG